MSTDNRHPSKTARAKAMLVNSLLLVWTLNAALAIADTALVLANGSRALSPISGAMGFVFQGLEATLIWAMLWPRGLPRRTLWWMFGAAIVLGVVSSFFFTETDLETITLESMIYWPATDALPGLVASFLSLMIGIAGYRTLHRQCGVTGYYLDARSLATVEVSGRNFLEILADTQQGRLAYLAKAFLINVAPIFLVIFTVGTLDMVFVDIINLEEGPHEYASPAAMITGLLLIAPVLETLGLWFLIFVFRKITGGRVLASAGLVGVTIGLAHLINDQSVGYLILCLAICWSFFVQALVFLAWEKHGRWKALVMVAILHALHNTGPAIMGVSEMEPPRPHESNEPVLVKNNRVTDPRSATRQSALCPILTVGNMKTLFAPAALYSSSLSKDSADEPATKPAPKSKAAGPALTRSKPVPVVARPEGPAGTIEGKITLTGDIPEMPLLRRGSDPACDNGELRAETITANAEGGLANVLVRVKPGTVPAWTPSQPIVIDQTDCMYRPRVTGGVRGQRVEVRNSDKTTHNVHARHLPLGRRQGIDTIVNRAQPSGVSMSFELGDEPVAKLKCDYHGWMQGYVVVSDNPYFAVSGANGSFKLEGAPAGLQTIEFWHEYYGLKEATAEVATDGSVTLDASYDASKDDPMTSGGRGK